MYATRLGHIDNSNMDSVGSLSTALWLQTRSLDCIAQGSLSTPSQCAASYEQSSAGLSGASDDPRFQPSVRAYPMDSKPRSGGLRNRAAHPAAAFYGVASLNGLGMLIAPLEPYFSMCTLNYIGRATVSRVTATGRLRLFSEC